MDCTKEQNIRMIEHRARNEMACLAGQLTRAKSAAKEPILAGMEFARWLADTSHACRRPPER